MQFPTQSTRIRLRPSSCLSICLTEAALHAQGHGARVEAALLLPPYYFASASEEGLEKWMRLVLESAHQPVYLYNFPQHTGNFISPQLYKRLGQDFPLLRGIKNTFDDVPLAKQFKEALPDRQASPAQSPKGFAQDERV